MALALSADFLTPTFTPKTYFHPLASDHKKFSSYKAGDLELARKISDNILCLTLHHDISEEDITRVVGLIEGCSQINNI